MRQMVLLVSLLAPALAQAQVAAIDEPEQTAGVDDELAIPPVTAEPPLTPPVPVLMPELVARNRMDIGLITSSAAVVNMFELQVAGGYAWNQLEIFGDIRARTWRDIDSSEDPGSAAFGNIKLGARYHVPVGEFVLAPQVIVWLPTATGGLDHWNELTRMGGVSDGRAYVGEGGLGVAGAVAWRRGSGFIQLESGLSFVAEHGPQVASMFAALGAGRQFTEKLALMVEWRFEMFPIYDTIQGPGFAIVRGNDDMRLRMRFHPFWNDDIVGGLCGFDILKRFP